jgi:biopolymer transport protein ExbB
MIEASGVFHFLGGQDAVGCFVLSALALMSLASWTVLIAKLWRHFSSRGANDALLANLEAANDMESWRRMAGAAPEETVVSRLVVAGAAACAQLRAGGKGSFQLVSPDDYVSMAIQGALDEATGERESGLAVLASVGATAPFVGLFGTVWSIYQALENIGVSGQGTLDKVAGPVGEALIMTACGLAVAVPAVLGYNALIRINRARQSRMEQFARKLFGLLATGKPLYAGEEHAPVPSLRPVLKEV